MIFVEKKNLTKAILCTLAASLFFWGGIQVGEAANIRDSAITSSISLDNIDSIEVNTPQTWWGAPIGILAYNNDITLDINKIIPLIFAGDNYNNRDQL